MPKCRRFLKAPPKLNGVRAALRVVNLDTVTSCRLDAYLCFQVKVLEGSLAAQRADPNSLAALIQVSPLPTTLTTPSFG